MKCICDVVMLTWNQLDATRKCIKSFLANTCIPARLIIIDNNSGDGTRDYLSSLKNTENHQVEIILNSENKGFVRGMNQGIEISDAPYVCLANNDLIFTKGWLKEVIDVFDKYKRAGVLNPNSNNLGVSPEENLPLEDFANRLKNKDKGIFVEMPYCIGFCMVIRREVIERVGGLSDEFYPMFFEDSDYSMKAQKAGFRIGIAKASYVFHDEHASTGKIGSKKERIFLKSRGTFIKKWGRMLRIAWIMDDFKDLPDKMEEAVCLARQGNFIWFFIKNLNIDREEFFKKANHVEHAGIQFINFKNIFDLIWKILKKKKKYDVIINKNKLLNCLFKIKGSKTLIRLNKQEVEGIKQVQGYGQ